MANKNKIPIWENNKDYRPELEHIVGILLSLSDKDYQVRVWVHATLPEMEWYGECMHMLDYQIDYFKWCVREGKFHLTWEEIRSVLRVGVMCNHFDAMIDWDSVPQEWEEEQFFIINHPYFEKIRQQAAYALSFFRLEKDEETEPASESPAADLIDSNCSKSPS